MLEECRWRPGEGDSEHDGVVGSGDGEIVGVWSGMTVLACDATWFFCIVRSHLGVDGCMTCAGDVAFFVAISLLL